MRWFRARDDTKTIPELRRRVAQLHRQIAVHEQQIARLEARTARSPAEPEFAPDRLDAYLGQALPLIVLGLVGGAIAVVSFFTVEAWGRLAMIWFLLVAGGIALVAVHRLTRRLHADRDRQEPLQRLALGLYAVGVACFIASSILIAAS